MATNGCLHFNLTGSYCGDYTPDPLPQYTNTLFPFWTDLIKDGGSAMKAKAFDDYTIFGWYKMREYNRANSDNSLEVWLYPNNTYEFRYGELDINAARAKVNYQGGNGQAQLYAEGRNGVPFRIGANADLRPDLWRVALDGRANGIDFKTRNPARIIPGKGSYQLQPVTVLLSSGSLQLAGRYGDGLKIQIKGDKQEIIVHLFLLLITCSSTRHPRNPL